MYLAADGKLLGLLAVSDPIKASTPEALLSLEDSGLRIIMATGDGLTTAKSVGAKLGISEVYGEVKPADKLDLVKNCKKKEELLLWLVMELMMHQPWLRLISESQWARELM
jgi:Cu+-exporting ATPase